MENFKTTLYEAVLVSFAKILAKYDLFTQNIIMRDIGKDLIGYLNEHGFEFNETGSIDDLDRLIDLFIKNGFAESLTVTPAEHGINYSWKNLYGIDAYRELYDLSLNPFLACPLNLAMYYISGEYGKKLVMHRKDFVSDSIIEAQCELVDDDTPPAEWVLDEMVVDSARMFEIAYERQKLYLQQVNTDYLTGLHSRRFIVEKGDRLFHYSRVDGRPFSVLVMDIDHFKEINDTYGHITGDSILLQLAEILKKAIRESDLVGRIGGEEFLFLLPGTPLDHAIDVAERLRKEVELHEFTNQADDKIEMTISIGVVYDDGHMEDFKALVEKGDAALYKAKKNGRNRIINLKSNE
jgi:diguanylate cyclase (GGDEF)-like protein